MGKIILDHVGRFAVIRGSSQEGSSRTWKLM